MSRPPQFQNCTSFTDAWNEFYDANRDYFNQPGFTPDQQAKVQLQIRAIFLSAYAAGAVVFMAEPKAFLTDLQEAGRKLSEDQKEHIKLNPLDDPTLTQGPAN